MLCCVYLDQAQIKMRDEMITTIKRKQRERSRNGSIHEAPNNTISKRWLVKFILSCVNYNSENMVIILIIFIKIEWRDEKADKMLCIVSHVTVNRSSVSMRFCFIFVCVQKRDKLLHHSHLKCIYCMYLVCSSLKCQKTNGHFR